MPHPQLEGTLSDLKIADGRVGLFHYTLRDAAGKQIDSSQDGAPMAFLAGASNIVPGLEKPLIGHSAGESMDVVVSPADGYGEKTGPGPQSVHRRDFPKTAELHVGMAFRAEGGDGEQVVLFISKIEGAHVWVDTNHPLAGEELHFAIKLVEVREASAEEKAHGHAHGPGGHH
jgi:FKBP-type peptidyl-prolyl cis-trans isomerase SlyD